MASDSSTGTASLVQALRPSGSSFLEALGREMDTALSSLLAASERLDGAPSEAEHPGPQIHEQGERLREVFRSLEYLAHLEEDASSLASDAVDLVDLAETLLERYEPSARAHGLDLTLEAPDDSVELVTDPTALRQLLAHLLSNAVAFTPEGTVTLTVEVEDEAAAVHVEDTGIGLPDGARSHVFEPFAQRLPEEWSGPEGLGLGLTLARALVQHLDGSIEVESKPGEGSVFTVEVPRRTGGGTAPSGEAAPEEGTRLLILEDNEVTQKLLRRMLEQDYQVDVVDRADDAIQHAEGGVYDALILDINLGERRTGVEVLHEVRRMEDYSDLPAVACTAYALDGHREQFLQVGFNEVVTKPVTKRELLDVIDRLLEDPSAPETDDLGEIATGVELPPIPSTLMEITGLISHGTDSPDTETLTEVLEKDQVVSFWLLRHINSAYYSINESVETVERAVRYLGFRPVCNLVLTKVMARNFSDVEGPGAERVQQYIMKTGSLAAFMARALAERFELDTPKIAYTAGLLAQLGRLALLTAEEETYVNLWFEGDERTDEAFNGPPPRGQEILHCKKNYLEKGVAVGRACELSDELLAVLRSHPHPLQAESRFQPLVAIVALALGVAYLIADPEQESWDGEAALIEELQDSEVAQFLVDEGPLSLEELTYAMTEVTEEAQDFVSSVMEPA